jgi:hypothetical protein
MIIERIADIQQARLPSVWVRDVSFETAELLRLLLPRNFVAVIRCSAHVIQRLS